MDDVERPCEGCGEPTSTAREPPVCRDCYIGGMIDDQKCAECGQVVWNENALYFGMQPFDHTVACKAGALERERGLGLTRGWTMATACASKAARVAPKCRLCRLPLIPEDDEGLTTAGVPTSWRCSHCDAVFTPADVEADPFYPVGASRRKRLGEE